MKNTIQKSDYRQKKSEKINKNKHTTVKLMDFSLHSESKTMISNTSDKNNYLKIMYCLFN